METMQDVRSLLHSFGSFIYTKDQAMDTQLMADELDELAGYGIIDESTKAKAKIILRRAEKQPSPLASRMERTENHDNG
ncbi:uncharacterized protein YqgQ [Salsuginibacillus halophilus]|uniref:Uncharacterized protein YqgQ n=1 Tax=Salsuginibacillus halophilus TaxID=517424 RepID=A0A2P8H7W7_9BACI|nr:YqgQ family protein [Salsuginibacillus halophilus]PSL42325.1 uncharacterized protein YqgQ [Salsuginibacillus halophilus]